MTERTGLAFRSAPNAFAAIGAQDTAVELSGQLRVTAITLDPHGPDGVEQPHRELRGGGFSFSLGISTVS